jgi:hypothetical protein
MARHWRLALMVFAAILLFGPGQAEAQQRPPGFGLGIIAGEPSGLSFKYWIDGRNAVDGALAWSFVDEGAFHVHADYLWHVRDVVEVESEAFPLYFGVGGRIKTSDDTRAGVRVPLGIDYMFRGAPVNVFFELVPLLDLTPKTEFKFNAAIGGRYFFGG